MFTFKQKKNFVEPYWRPARSFQLRMDHPDHGMHNNPGSFGNEYSVENYEFMKQKTYLEWNPPKSEVKPVNAYMYDKVKPYDITKEI